MILPTSSPPLLSIKFFDTNNFVKHRRVPLRKFSALWDKKFSTENYEPPPLIHKLFRYRKFSETQYRRVPLRNFSALWDEKFLTENRDTPSLHHPFLSIIFFDTRSFVKHRRVPLRSFSVPWDNKFSIENRDISLIGIKFFDTWNNETLKGSPTIFFGTVRQKIFDRKSWYSLPPPPPLIHKIFRH